MPIVAQAQVKNPIFHRHIKASKETGGLIAIKEAIAFFGLEASEVALTTVLKHGASHRTHNRLVAF